MTECTLRYLPATAFDPESDRCLKLTTPELASIRATLRRHASKRKRIETGLLMKGLSVSGRGQAVQSETTDAKQPFDFLRCTIHVGNLSPALASEEALRTFFMPLGLCIQASVRHREGRKRPVIRYESCNDASCALPTDGRPWISGENNCWALVTFEMPAVADTVMEEMIATSDGVTLNTATVSIEQALASTGSFASVWSESKRKSDVSARSVLFSPSY